MEALAAVALAGNVAQFLEYAIKAVSKTHELLKNPDGTLQENVDLEFISESTKWALRDKKQFETITADTVDSLNAFGQSWEAAARDDESLGPVSGGPSAPGDDGDKVLRNLVFRCRDIAGKILGILQGLKVWNESRRRVLMRIEVATKTWLKRPELQELRDRLCALRDQISTHLLALLVDQQRSLAQNVRNLSTLNEESCKEIGAKLDGIIRGLRSSAYGSDSGNGQVVKSEAWDPEAHAGLPVDKLNYLQKYTGQMLSFADQKRAAILETLHFTQLEEREFNILDAHRETFEWIFKQDSGSNSVSDSSAVFIEWLQHSDGVFWVTGKAGSGKSTLMKFLTHHGETERLLKKWAGASKLIIARHYFWSLGTPVQKSQEGLLRALLLQIFRQNTALIRVACPDRWNSPYADSFNPWSRTQLITAFENLGNAADASWKICLFIDGLDEYRGDMPELLGVVERIKGLAHVKICASSRPWVEFLNAFEDDPWKLYLHDLTHADIFKFVNDSLSENKRFGELQKRNRLEAESLSLEVTDRAQGVFLWVFLIVRSLLRGLQNEDDIQDLQTRLRELPTDLKETFDRMLMTIEELYRVRTARLFLTMTHAASTFPVITFYFMDFGDKSVPKEPLPFLRHWPNLDAETDREAAMIHKKRQLIAQCKDLIFITPAPGAPDLFDERVGFLHRTVVDYIQTEDVEAQLKRMAGDFSPDRILLGANLGQLRSLIHQHRLTYILPHFRQWILGGLYYARRLEVLSGEAGVEVLDDLRDIIMSGFRRWGFEEAMRTVFGREDISSFLELACRVDLALYARQKFPGMRAEDLDAEVSGWRNRIGIRRGAGFEMCNIDGDGRGDEDDWRLWREVRAAALPPPRVEARVSPPTTPVNVGSPQGRGEGGNTRVENGDLNPAKRQRGKFSSKFKSLFRRKGEAAVAGA